MNRAKAITKYLRISQRKAVLAAQLIRGCSVDQALLQLLHCNLKAGRLLKKTLDSAVANAENNLGLRRENLKVLEVKIDRGPQSARGKPKNKGGSHRILRRTSHFTVEVGEV